MIEKIVLDYLEKGLNIPVFMEEPSEELAEYIVIEKTSGHSKDHIDSATLAIQSYGMSLYEAACLNDKMKKVMNGITELSEISSVSLNRDYNYTDTVRKKYRYQAVYDVVYF